MTQAIIYCRFSPRPDAQTSTSNEAQEAGCRVYCDRQRYQVIAVFADVDISGATINRPKLKEALDAMQLGMVLVAYDTKRLARDMLVSLEIDFQVRKRGASIEFADGTPMRTTPMGRLVQNFLAAIAQYEREHYAGRTKAGLARKKANGEWIGRPPIGYRIIKQDGKKVLKPDIQEQEALESAKFMLASGKQYDYIADRLTEAHGLCRGRPWCGRTIRRALARQQC